MSLIGEKRSNHMNNRLVILGTNEYQNPLIIRAKELGYETTRCIAKGRA